MPKFLPNSNASRLNIVMLRKISGQLKSHSRSFNNLFSLHGVQLNFKSFVSFYVIKIRLLEYEGVRCVGIMSKISDSLYSIPVSYYLTQAFIRIIYPLIWWEVFGCDKKSRPYLFKHRLMFFFDVCFLTLFPFKVYMSRTNIYILNRLHLKPLTLVIIEQHIHRLQSKLSIDRYHTEYGTTIYSVDNAVRVFYYYIWLLHVFI